MKDNSKVEDCSNKTRNFCNTLLRDCLGNRKSEHLRKQNHQMLNFTR